MREGIMEVLHFKSHVRKVHYFKMYTTSNQFLTAGSTFNTFYLDVGGMLQGSCWGDDAQEGTAFKSLWHLDGQENGENRCVSR